MSGGCLNPNTRQVAPSSYVCSVVVDAADFLALREEWTELLLHSLMPNVFLSWEWMAAWMQSYSRHGTPHIVLVRRAQDQMLLGLAPLYRIPVFRRMGLRTLSFMGTGVGADHLAFISRAGVESEVHCSLTEYLVSFSKWDVLEFPRIDEKLGGYLLHSVSNQSHESFGSSLTVADQCPFIPLPKTWADYLNLIGSGTREEIARKWRRLRKQGEIVIERVQKIDDLEKAWEVLVRLHRDRRDSIGGRSAFVTRRARVFHRNFIEMALLRGWLRLYLLRVNGNCVAAEYCLHIGDRVTDFQSGFDVRWSRFGVGTLLIAHAIQEAIQEGASEFDFLRGGEAYKQHQWAAVLRRDASLVIWRRNPRVSLVTAVRGWSRTIRSRVLGRLGTFGDPKRSVVEDRV